MDKLKKILLSQKECLESCYKGMLVQLYFDEERNIFKLKSLVFSEKDYIPHSIRGCVERVRRGSLEKKYPAYLERDAYSIYFVQEVPGKVNISSMKLVRIFVFAARAWATILKRIANQDLKNV